MGGAVDEQMGKRLRFRRRALGMTLGQLAPLIGVRLQQIHKYECGESRMSAVRVWELAHALRVPVNYFFEGLTGQAARDPSVAEDGLRKRARP
jgi:transcriptional regulator with XRE-family HTH domain